ncbi:hypothetical protein EMMF5_006549, partial [Cystobasidiomycetes sp. EMM_F5]
MAHPKFSDLPLDTSHPDHSAWFAFGKEDELGTLNHLTQEVVREAAKEIRLGLRVSLNLPLDQPKYPYLNRCAYEQKIINKAPRIINDDVVTFNTQIDFKGPADAPYGYLAYIAAFQQGSQWDSFRHFAYQKEGKFYNNVGLDAIIGENASTRNGIQAVAEAGIAGRGVLLDFYEYAQVKSLDYEPWSQYGITLDELEQVRKHHNVEYKAGDIIFIRTGHIKRYQEASDEQRKASAVVPHKWSGVKQSKDVLAWIWDNKF